MNTLKRIKLFFFPDEQRRWHIKTMKELRKKYPRGTDMRLLKIHLEYRALLQNEQEKEYERIFWNRDHQSQE